MHAYRGVTLEYSVPREYLPLVRRYFNEQAVSYDVVPVGDGYRLLVRFHRVTPAALAAQKKRVDSILDTVAAEVERYRRIREYFEDLELLDVLDTIPSVG